MKTIFRFTLLALIVTAFCACDDDKSYVAPLDVTPNNLAGTWQLAQWNGAPLAQGSYVYIEFIRKDQKYVMYQNLDSFGARKLTGRFAIETDEELGAIIYGNYDYSAGDWQHSYIVTDFSKTQMIWTAKDDRSDISVYERCDGIRGYYRRENGVIKSSRRKEVKGTPTQQGSPFYLLPGAP